MAIGAFVDGPAGGAGYNGRVTSFVVLSCIVAGSGGILFGYDLGISGTTIPHTTTISIPPPPVLMYLYLGLAWIVLALQRSTGQIKASILITTTTTRTVTMAITMNKLIKLDVHVLVMPDWKQLLSFLSWQQLDREI
jgi:hypothetical protein